MESKASKILSLFRKRFERISTNNGFNTNVGPHVFDSRTYFDWEKKADFPALSIFWLEEKVDSIANTSVIQVMTVVIEAHDIAETTNPGPTIRNLITDIKQAALDPKDLHLGGLAHSIRPIGLETQPQEDGLHIVSIRLTYEIRYVETYGI